MMGKSQTILLFVLALMLGIGRNLPFDNTIYGITLADVLVLLMGIRQFLISLHDSPSFGVFNVNLSFHALYCLIFIAVIGLISIAFNYRLYGGNVAEIFEMGRYVLLGVMAVTLPYYFKGRPLLLFTGFFVGLTVSFGFAYQSPMNADVQGFRQIFNPNVHGVLFGIIPIFSMLVVQKGYPIFGVLTALAACFMSLFTFSKASWLLCAMGVMIVGYALVRQFRKYNARTCIILFCLFFVITLGAILSLEAVSNLIVTKIAVTEFGLSASEGGSASARAGLIYSGIIAFADNWLIGIGPSNFETVHMQQKAELGSHFYPDDNPNSAFVYIASSFGIFGILIWMWLFILVGIYLHKLTRDLIVTISCMFLLFLAGNVQNEILNAYYFWVIIAFITILLEETKKGASDVSDFGRPSAI